MAGTSFRVRRGFVLALIGVICATFITPLATSADTNLEIGGKAVIAYANGDQVRLRQEIGYESPVLANYGEGTSVTVQDGPFTDAVGNYWYQVSVDNLTGYIVADYLALESGVSLEIIAQADAGTSEENVAEPEVGATGAVVGIAYVAGTNGDGVRCRTGAASTFPVIMVVPEASTIQLTGVPVDGWQPINCGGVGGFVSEQFVSYELPTVPQAPADETSADQPAQDGGTTDSDSTAPDDSAQSDEAVAPEDDETAAPVAGTITGQLLVTGTNGDGVRCRARAGYHGNVVTILPEGATVDLNGAAQGEWQPVYCGGSTGFVHASFLASTPVADEATDDTAADAEGDVADDEGLAVGGPTATAVVAGTNGDGVRCRNGAGYSSATISVLAEGTSVTVRGNAQGDWLPVTCGGQNGFVSTAYLKVSGAADNPTTAVALAAAATGSATVTSSGGLNCRASASMSGRVITVLANGSSVTLRSGSTSGWQAVVCNGQNGFAASRYLSGSTTGAGDSTSDSNSGSSAGSYISGASLKISGTGGGGLRLRSAAGYNGSVLAIIGEGATVTVRSGSSGEWVAVSYNGSNGFVHKDFVTATTGSTTSSSSSGNPGSTGSTTTALANGSHARATADLNLRYSGSYSAGVAAVAPAGTVVLVTGVASGGYYPVDWDGLKGYMHGDYLTSTSQALSERGGSAATPDGSVGNTQSGSASGNTIVSYAMRYLGYPYVWAAAGPSSFDCSGFIYWVVTNATGKSIGRVLTTQITAGAAVSRDSLQPGDLVFFQNTYQAGLSHGGIYIGNGQFIHASNPSTGVIVSDLSSSYYASRWLGAVRLG
ncbi:MAG: SH3 domain-containing C40 family peptidase [Thermomicrobiales bacterium]